MVSTSISGRLNLVSDLEQQGVINKDQKGNMKVHSHPISRQLAHTFTRPPPPSPSPTCKYPSTNFN
jgi:hypothetical protein